MVISSRTPEGEGNTCQVCGKRFVLEPSTPAHDAPCPHCGTLAWFLSADANVEDADFDRDPDLAAAFRSIHPTMAPVPLAIELPEAVVDSRAYRWGRWLKPFVVRWSPRRRAHARLQMARLLQNAARCAQRADLEQLIGEPRIVFFDDGGFRNEYYETDAGNLVLRFASDRLIAFFGMIPFSSLESGAGLPAEADWQEVTPVQTC